MANRSLCRSCNAPIRWAMTEAGKLIPLDLAGDAFGNIEETGTFASSPRRAGEQVAVVRVLGSTPSLLDDPDALRYYTHFATCPNARSRRRVSTR